MTGALCRRGCPESHEEINFVEVELPGLLSGMYFPRNVLWRTEVTACPKHLAAIRRERARRRVRVVIK
jgi:hypothetical protein